MVHLLAALLLMNSSDPAFVGNLSRGSSSMFTASVEHALERAMHWSRSREDETTIEHFLLALLEEHDARKLLQAHQVDMPALREALLVELDTAPSPAESLPRIMQLMVRQASPARSPALGGADVLTAILSDNQSHAADLLQSHGLTLPSAQSHRDDIQEARTRQEQEQNAHLKHQLEVLESTTVTQHLEYTEPLYKRYRLRVSRAETMTDQVTFKGAVSHDGELTLLIEPTPFEMEFVASQVVGLFEGLNHGRLRVELIDRENGDRVVSGFSGQSGAIFKDPRHPDLQRSGTM